MIIITITIRTTTPITMTMAIGHYRNVRGLGKSMVVSRLFEKVRYSNERFRVLTMNTSIWRRKMAKWWLYKYHPK